MYCLDFVGFPLVSFLYFIIFLILGCVSLGYVISSVFLASFALLFLWRDGFLVTYLCLNMLSMTSEFCSCHQIIMFDALK